MCCSVLFGIADNKMYKTTMLVEVISCMCVKTMEMVLNTANWWTKLINYFLNYCLLLKSYKVSKTLYISEK